MKTIVFTPSYTKFIKIHYAFLFVLLSVNFNVLFAQTAVPFKARFNVSLRGDLTMISNNILNRDGGNGAGTNVPYNGERCNNHFDMQYIDVDSDPTTDSSSSATFSFPENTCSKVKFAGLYWGAIYMDSNRDARYTSVKLKLPGTAKYVTVAATDIIFNDQNTFDQDPYACFADVTNLVTGLTSPEGEYTVANIFASLGKDSVGNVPDCGTAAGWTLVIVYENPKLPNRNITIFDGFSGVTDTSLLNSATINVNGFTTIPNGHVRARIAVSCLEGDREYDDDRYSISTSQNTGTDTALFDTANPVNNFFNSSISIDGTQFNDRVPNSGNSLGWDSDLFTISNPGNSVIGNNETSATLKLKTDGDTFFVFQTSFVVDVISPEITLLKTVDDGNNKSLKGQDVTLGDSLWYQLEFNNSGNDDATKTMIIDSLPINVDLVESSISSLISGVTYSYIPPAASSGGVLKFLIDDKLVTKGGAKYKIRFKVKITDQCNNLRNACENKIENQAFSYYSGKVSNIDVIAHPSFNSLDKCGAGIPGATNFLVDVKGCTLDRTEVLCSGNSLVLTAGSGYASYEWKNPSGQIILGKTSKTLKVDKTGVYTVKKTAKAPCVTATEIINVVSSTDDNMNPLLRKENGKYLFVDVVKTCENNGNKLAEIYFCSTTAFKNINLGALDTQEIKWQKLDKNLEIDPSSKCPNVDATNDKWTTVGSTNSFKVENPGDYRLNIVFKGGCQSYYYFKVFKAPVKAKAEKLDILCDKDGSITIVNIPDSLYEFSFVKKGETAGVYKTERKFIVKTPGDYTVYYRHKDAPETACVSKIEDIHISKLDITVTPTEKNVSCKGANGSIRVQVGNVPGPYTIVLKDMKGAKIGTYGPNDFGDYTFDKLSEGSYQVVATAGGCSKTIGNIKIKNNNLLSLKAFVKQHISCEKGKIEVSVLGKKGGKESFSYAIDSFKLDRKSSWTTLTNYNYQTSNIFDIPLDDAGTYIFRMIDNNSTDKACPVLSNKILIYKEAKVAYTVSKTDVKCKGTSTGSITIQLPRKLNGNVLSFTLYDGVVGKEIYEKGSFTYSKTFSGKPAGGYTLVVRVKKGDSFCYFPETIRISEPENSLSGTLTLKQDIVCFENGEISIVGTGGKAPYTYSIDGTKYGDKSEFSKLTAGTYYGYIKDVDGCPFTTKPITIQKLDPPTALAFNNTAISCPSLSTNLTVNVTGGVGNLVYEIIAPAAAVTNNGNINVFTGLSEGATYTIRVTDEKNCVIEAMYKIEVTTKISVTGTVDNDVNCKETATGKATFTVTGFSGTYSYAIGTTVVTFQSASSIVLNALAAGNHTLTVTDDTTNCTSSHTVTIRESILATSMSLQSTSIICNKNATITVTASGGGGGFQYQLETSTGTVITPYNNNLTFINVTQGSYNVFVRDLSGCVISQNINIGAATGPSVRISLDSPCYTSTGNVTITAVGTGIAPLRYSLDGGNFKDSPIFANVNPGNYSVRVKDGNGCETVSSVLTVSSELSLSAQFLNITACGSSTNVTITAIGGDGTYTYAIVNAGLIPVAANFSTINPITVTSVGNYDVYVKDGKDCRDFINITVTKDPALTVSVNTSSVLCSGDLATLTVTAAGGEAPYTYRLLNALSTEIRPSQPSSVFTNVPVGNYIVSVSDIRSCSATSTLVNVTEPNSLSAVVGVTALVSCSANSTAEVRVANAIGGTPFPSPTPYRYSFDGELNYGTSNIQQLPVGIHTVYIQDMNGCSFPMNVEVLGPLAAPNYTRSSSVVYNCSGLGAFTVKPDDPTPLYRYTYSIDKGPELTPAPGEIDYTFTGLTVGNHIVQMNYTSLVTPMPSVLFRETFGTGANTTNTNVGPAYCYEPQDGTGSCNFGRSINDGEYCVTQAVAAPFFTWRSPNDRSGVPNGRFLVINIGNTVGVNGIIYQQAVTDAIPNRDITVQLSAFNLLMSTVNGQADPNIVVQLTDALGVVLLDASSNPIQASTGDIPKNTGATNWIDCNLTLNPGSNTAFNIVIRSNSTAIMGNDIAIDDILVFQLPRQCPTTIEIPFTLEVKDFNVSSSSKNVTCNGGTDGSISVQVNNIDPFGKGYRYKVGAAAWSALQFSSTLTVPGLNAGSHTVYFEPVNPDGTTDCPTSITETIKEPTAVIANASITGNITCTNNGATITASASGGTGPYQYQLETPTGGVTTAYQKSKIFSGVAPGTYNIRVIDKNNCEVITGTQIVIAAPTTIVFGLVETNCYAGDNNGSIVVTVTAGNGMYEFSRNGTSFYRPSPSTALTYTFKKLTPDNYTIYVRDKNGCLISMNVTIEPSLSASAGLVKDIECKLPTGGQISITTNGGNGTYTYRWSDDAGVTWYGSNILSTSTGGTFTYGTAGSYIFKVTDASGCEVTTKKINLTLPIEPDFTLSPTNVLCNGDNSGVIKVTIDKTKGLAPFLINVYNTTLKKDMGVQTINLLAGDYKVTVTDEKGCSKIKNITISQPIEIDGHVTSTDITCANPNNVLGTITIDASGTGTPPYTYRVYNTDLSFDSTVSSAASHTFTNLNFGLYKVDITDANQCLKITSTSIGTAPNVLVTTVGAPTCSTGSITVQANTTTVSPLSNGPYYFSIYPVASLAPSGAGWYRGISVTLPNATTTENYTFNGLTPGVRYTFEVYDASTGCSFIQEANNFIIPVSTLVATIDDIKEVTCRGSSDGVVAFSITNYEVTATQVDYQVYQTVTIKKITGQSGSFTGLNGASASASLTGLAPGEYFIQFTEVNGGNPGCISTSAPFLIGQSPKLLEIKASFDKNENCSKLGSVKALAKFGTPPYTYQIQLSTDPIPTVSTWTGVNTNGEFKKAKGTYKVFVKDAFNCIKGSLGVIIGLDPSPSITATADYAGCPSEGNFKVSINLDTAGIPPYYLQINGGAKKDITKFISITKPYVISGLSSGSYTFKVFDANGCSETVAESVTIAAPLEFNVSISKLLDCLASPNAEITITGVVGSGSYTYEIVGVEAAANSQVAGTPLGLPTTIWTQANIKSEYKIIITDVNTTCSVSKSVFVQDKIQPVVDSFQGTDVTCNGADNGSITITAKNNGIKSFTFEITAPLAIAATTFDNFTATFDKLKGNVTGIVYTVKITGANGCVTNKTVTIKEPSLVSIDKIDVIQFGCTTGNSPNTASITVATVSGGNGGSVGTYTKIEFVNSDGDTVQSGIKNTLNILYNTALDSYDVAMGTKTPGEFTINVYDSKGCMATSTRTILPFDEINDVTISIIEPISCVNAGEDIQINVNSSNSDLTRFEYSDDNGVNYQALNQFSDLAIGVHYFLVRHQDTKCVYSISHQVKEPNIFTAKVDIVSHVNCKGTVTGEVTFELVDASYVGGFNWEIFDTKGTLTTDADDTSVDTGTETANGPTSIVNIAAGSYYVVLTQANIPTCNNRVYFTINEPALVLSGTRTINPITCVGNDGVIAITPKGGWGNYQYYVGNTAPSAGSWVSTSSFTGLKAGTYQVWLKDSSVCEVQLPDVDLKNPTAITATLGITNQNCLGTNGAVVVTGVTGGDGVNYVYQLFRNGIMLGASQSSPVFGNLIAGDYHVDITDSWGCTGTTGTDIKLFEVLVPRITIDKGLDCTVSPGGAFTASVTGGSGSFNYVITFPDSSTRTNTTGVFTNLRLTGTYTIVMTDTQTNCSASETETLVAASGVALLPSSVTDVKCFGGSDGVITVNMNVSTATTNNEPVYTYQIISVSPLVAPQNTAIFTDLPKGTYTIRVVSSKGCFSEVTADVNEPVALSVAASATTFACTSNNLSNTVLLTAVAANGTSGYVYSINGVDFKSSNTFDIVDTGAVQNITVTVKDANGCSAATLSPVIINPLPSLMSVTVNQNIAITCRNPENVIVTVVGGSGDFTYELLPIGTNKKVIISQTQDFDLPSAGTYTFKVIDNITGCSIVSVPYNVGLFDVISVEAVATQSSQCFGDSQGALEFKVLNYSGSFSWIVTNTAGTMTRTGNSITTNNPIKVPNLIGGNFSVYVNANDPAFCDALSNVLTILSPSDALSLTLNVSHKETCDPGSDGEITAIGDYGWGTYQYQLELGATIVVAYSSGSVFSNLNAGTYTVRVKDINGCSISKDIEIKPALPIAATASANSLLCYGDLIGEVTVVATGGQGPGTYVYSLVDADGKPSAYQSSPVFSNLVAGTYTVLVTDDLFCEVITLPVTVVAPPIVVASARITTTPSCTVSGVIQVTASGGDGGPYTYSNDGVTFGTVNSFTVSPVVSTTYQYFVKDASGCISYVSNGITIHPIAPLKVIIDAVNATISCNGGTSAVISSITSGGMGNYSYELLNENDVVLDGPQNSSIFTGLGAGIYKVRVNSLDCQETTDPVTLTDPKMLKLPLRPIFTNITCYGEVDGTITVDAEGGTGNLIYSIDQIKYVNSNTFKGLKAGLYTVTVQDENGCYVNQDITIVEPKLLEFKFGLIRQEKCANDKDGSIAIMITGGTAPYFTKLNADGVFVEGKLLYDNLEGGHTYAIYLKDSSGCDKNLVVKLDAPVDLNFKTMIDYGCDGTTKIIASVALQYKNEVTYIMVSNSNTLTNTTGVFENVMPGTYLIEVEHVNGCSPSQSYVDVKKVLPLIASLEETFVNTITAKVAHGIPPYEYRLDEGDFGNSNQFIITKTGTYTVDVRDSRGCITSAKIDMEFITVFVPNFFTPDGDGKNDYWYPQKLMAYPNIKVSIYDRYSRLVGEFRGPQIGWDGNLNGKALPSGDYWYVIVLDGLQGDKRKMMGNFTLYR